MRKSLVLLGILDDSDVEWMLRVGFKENVKNGARLIVKGEAIDSLYVVLSGKFAVNEGVAGKRIATLQAGEILGEMSFVDSRPPSATVLADQDAVVLNVPRPEIRERLDDDPAFGARLYRAIAIFLSNRLRDTVTNLGYGQAARLHGDFDDLSEIPMDILDNVHTAGRRFTVLQERARSATK